MRRLIAAALCLVAFPAHSQDWATYEVCHPERIEVFPASLEPFTLDGLQDAAEALPNSTGRYWQITSPGGAVSHMFGTMHVNHPAILDLPDRVEADIRAAKVIALEVDYVFTSRAEYKRWAEAEDLLRGEELEPELSTLDLPPEIEDWIRARTDGIGWRSDAPDYLTLAGLANLILGDPCNDFASGIYPAQDGLIQMLGVIEGVRIVGLEAPNSLLETLKRPQNFALTRAIIAIYGAYLNPLRDAQGTATGYALYLRGQIGAMMLLDRGYAMAVFGEDEARRLLELTNGYLLNERNETFLTAALPYLEEGDAFLAIGAFHLPDTRGMVELLRAEGYKVERIILPGEVAQ